VTSVVDVTAAATPTASRADLPRDLRINTNPAKGVMDVGTGEIISSFEIYV